jgi:hypothetical protein
MEQGLPARVVPLQRRAMEDYKTLLLTVCHARVRTLK